MYRVFMDSETLFLTLLKEGPGVSALAIFSPLTPKAGRMAIANTRIPMPPSQWEMAFHRAMEAGAGIPPITVAPVVVKAATDSKMPSMKRGVIPVK